LNELNLLWPLAGACASFLLLMLMLRTGAAHLVLDQPNERSLHSHPTPRIGGIAIFIALCPLLLISGFALLAVLSALLCAISFLDDRFKLGVGLRFGAHAVAAIIFALFALSGLHWVAMACAVFALIWMSNLFNFMDGSDGLAGGMAVLGFGAYALAALNGQHLALGLAALCVSACTAGFLCFNFPPAKVFMGDSGSIPLGFLAAAMGLYGWHDGLWPLGLPLLVFSPFIVDATVTLLKRSWRREKIWRAHKTHYYQRLIQSGWSHRATAVAAYTLMLCCGVGGLLLIDASAARQTGVLLAATALYIVLALFIDRAWREHQRLQ
jgi:UDP-N-acetylmuramyl pentapeptide phosphotransferase/UDP-N-acetylglucosamine-1-phosphate transferase